MDLGSAPMGAQPVGVQVDHRGVLTMPQQVMDIVGERQRQEDLKASGKFTKTCADEMSNLERMAILMEEVGEATEAVYAATPTGGLSAHDLALMNSVIVVGSAARLWLNRRKLATDPNGGVDHPRSRKTDLRKELVQCGAVVLAALEGIDAEATESAEPGVDRT